MSDKWQGIVAGTALVLASGAAGAAPLVDGTRDVDYGAPRAVQTVQTQFGDAAPPGALNGSELDAAYARVENGRLYLLFTGNHEPNFNKLDVFIDSVAGGENTLSATPQYDFNDNGTWISQNLQGLTFDTGFAPDYHLFSRHGGGTSPYEVDFVNRMGGASAMVPGASAPGSPSAGLISAGLILAGDVGPNASASSLTQQLLFAINNSNGLGVTGGTAAADQTAAEAVLTGMEFSIALADLGSPADGSVLRIAAMINNSNHNFLSNQILAGLPAGTGNLGGNGAGTLSGVDFNNFAGNQFFEVVVPEPGSLGLIGLMGVALLRRRRA